jgi:hypothetical protein
MLYKITHFEKKTVSTGKEKADVTLVDTNGIPTAQVTIWKNDLAFDSLTIGSELNGDIEVKQNGKFTNKTFKQATTAPAWATRKPTGAVEAAKVTSKSVSVAQDRKEASISLSAANRDATLLTVETIRMSIAISLHGQPITDEEVKATWLSWRKWLLDNNGSDMPFV